MSEKRTFVYVKYKNKQRKYIFLLRFGLANSFNDYCMLEIRAF